MTDPTLQHILARLDALQTEVAALRRYGRHRRTARRLLPLAVVALLVALVPLSSLAALTSNDLNRNSVHNANIQAIADAGITKGCDPGVAYCPNGLVTREEMASFLARTAGLGGNPPVANALTAQTAGAAQTLGGQPASGLARVALATAYVGGTELTISAVYPAFQEAARVTVIAPTAGFVVVSASALLTTPSTSGASVRLHDVIADRASPLLDGIQITPVSPVYVFPVAAGQRIFALEVTRCCPVDGRWRLNQATLTAVFLPFGYDGGTTLAP